MDERLAEEVALLRGLAAGALAAVAREPFLHRKRLLAEHARDDAAAAQALVAARVPDTEPAPAADPYGDAKPRLAAALRGRLAAADPRDDEAGYARLLELALMQERHVAELPA